MNIDKITQRQLNAIEKTERHLNLHPVLHCAGGDSEITLRIFVAVVLLKIKELNDQDNGNRKLRDDFCFIGLDL